MIVMSSGRWTQRLDPTARGLLLCALVGCGSPNTNAGDGGTTPDGGVAMGWSSEPSGGTSDLFAVAGNGSEVMAVGAAGVMLSRGASGEWRAVAGAPSTPAALRGLSIDDAGMVHVCGDGGALFRRIGGQWSQPDTSGTRVTLRGAWTAPSLILVVGDGGMVLISSGPSNDPNFYPTVQGAAGLTGVAGLSGRDYFVVDTAGTILRGNGGAQSPDPSGATLGLFGVARSGAVTAAVGEAGATSPTCCWWTWDCRTRMA